MSKSGIQSETLGFMRAHGMDPQSLLPQIVRERVYASRYWKEYCFGLDAETILDKVKDIECVGFCYGGFNTPSPFLCLLVKLLQISPDFGIIQAYLTHSGGHPVYDTDARRCDLRYLRALICLYVRLVASPLAVYQILEPLLNDYRKLIAITPTGHFEVMCMDEWISMLIDGRERIVFGLLLPLLQDRIHLEKKGLIRKYQGMLSADKGDESP